MTLPPGAPMHEGDNPYRAPHADLSVAETIRPGSPIKAVLLGYLVDTGGTLVSSFVIGIAFAIAMIGFGRKPEEMASLSGRPLFIGVAIVVGCSFSVLGGYVCARVAKHWEYRLGAIMAVLSSLTGMAFGTTHGPLYEFAMIMATFASILLGCRIGLAANRRDRQSVAQSP